MREPALIDAMATSDAAFDGRTYSALGAVDRKRYSDRCCAALAAIEAAGYVVAPATATDAMIAAAKGNNYEWPASCYDAMIDARPKVVTP